MTRPASVSPSSNSHDAHRAVPVRPFGASRITYRARSYFFVSLFDLIDATRVRRKKRKRKKRAKISLEKVHAPARSAPSTRRTTSAGRDAPRACSPREPIAAKKVKKHSSRQSTVASRRGASRVKPRRSKRRGHRVVTAPLNRRRAGRPKPHATRRATTKRDENRAEHFDGNSRDRFRGLSSTESPSTRRRAVNPRRQGASGQPRGRVRGRSFVETDAVWSPECGTYRAVTS